MRRIRILQGIGLDSLRLPNHRRCRDGFAPIRAGDPKKRYLVGLMRMKRALLDKFYRPWLI